MQMYVTPVDCREHPVVSSIVRRMYRLARMPPGHGEQLQVGRYGAGQFYEPHYDSEQSPTARLARPATVIVYLKEPAGGGGETVFPRQGV